MLERGGLKIRKLLETNFISAGQSVKKERRKEVSRGISCPYLFFVCMHLLYHKDPFTLFLLNERVSWLKVQRSKATGQQV